MSRFNVDRMRYQKDRLSYFLVLMGLVANVFYFIHIYRKNEISYTFNIGIDVVVNIVFMLFVFLAAENAKNYRRGWSFVCVFIGLVQCARIFFLPYSHYKLGELSQRDFMLCAIYLAASSFFLIAGAVACFVKSTILIKHIKQLEHTGEGNNG